MITLISVFLFICMLFLLDVIFFEMDGSKKLFDFAKKLRQRDVGWFFIRLPRNHIACVTIDGSFVHFIAHSEDKKRLLEIIQLVPTSVDSVKARAYIDGIKTRDTSKIWRWFVKLFNLHFKYWNPLSTLKTVSILPTRFNTDYIKTDDFRNLITKPDAPVKTEFLRIEFPRVGLAEDIELKDNVTIDLAWNINLMAAWDLYKFFFTTPNVSEVIDFQVRQALVKYMIGLSYDNLDRAIMGADPLNEFNKFMMEKNGAGGPNSGISHAGIVLIGPASIADYQLDEKAYKLAEAKAAEVASVALLAAKRNEAKGEAAIIDETGQAQARSDLARGQAKAKSAELFGAALDGKPHLAHVMGREALGNAKVVVLSDSVTAEGSHKKPSTITSTPVQIPIALPAIDTEESAEGNFEDSGEATSATPPSQPKARKPKRDKGAYASKFQAPQTTDTTYDVN